MEDVDKTEESEVHFEDKYGSNYKCKHSGVPVSNVLQDQTSSKKTMASVLLETPNSPKFHLRGLICFLCCLA